MMFALPPGTSAKLVHVNIRGEFHGNETIPQADLRFEVALPNDILDAFDEDLKACLYMRMPAAHPDAKLPELPGVTPVSTVPTLRFPNLSMPLRWDEEANGYTLVVSPMVHGSAPPLVLPSVRVGSVRLDCLDGGSVRVDFRIATTDAPDVDTIAELARYVQRTVTVELRPPAPPVEGSEFEPAFAAVPADAPF